MRYIIYCNEKNISTNIKSAISEFDKRLSAYCEIQQIISPTLSFPKDLKENNHSILYLTRGISSYSSVEFAKYINNIALSGKSNLHVVIGFHEQTLNEALINSSIQPEMISLTRISLSNETSMLMFLEQLYRSYTILQGKTYHK